MEEIHMFSNANSFVMLGGMMIFLILLAILLYIYVAITLKTIADKTGTPNSWLAWIPIANTYLTSQIAEQPIWQFILYLLGGFIPYIGPLIILGLGILWWWKISERLGWPGALSLLLLIPIINLVLLGIYAWKEPPK